MALRDALNQAALAQQQRRDSRPAPWLRTSDNFKLGSFIRRHGGRVAIERLELELGQEGRAALVVYMPKGAQQEFLLERRLVGADGFQAAAVWMVEILKGNGRAARDFTRWPMRASRDLQPGKTLRIEADNIGGASVS